MPLERCAGLVFGFLFREGQALRVNDETLARTLPRGHDWAWLHLSLADHRARRFLEGFEAVPADVRALLLGPEDRIQLHLTADGAFGILPDIERDFADHSLGSGRLRFWMDARHLVTVRLHPLRAVELVRHRVEEGEIPPSPAHLVFAWQDRFIQLVEARLAMLSADLARIEDDVLAEHSNDQTQLGPLRRELSRYAREFASLSRALARAISGRQGGLGPLVEHLPPLLQDVEDFQRDAAGLSERARLLYEEIDARIAATTNRSLSALTVISTLLLPPTFLVGAFGMNVPGIPWAGDHHGFWAALGLCLVMIVGCYTALRRFRILP